MELQDIKELLSESLIYDGRREPCSQKNGYIECTKKGMEGVAGEMGVQRSGKMFCLLLYSAWEAYKPIV